MFDDEILNRLSIALGNAQRAYERIQYSGNSRLRRQRRKTIRNIEIAIQARREVICRSIAATHSANVIYGSF